MHALCWELGTIVLGRLFPSLPIWNKSFVTARVKDSNLGVIAVASCAAIKK